MTRHFIFQFSFQSQSSAPAAVLMIAFPFFATTKRFSPSGNRIGSFQVTLACNASIVCSKRRGLFGSRMSFKRSGQASSRRTRARVTSRSLVGLSAIFVSSGRALLAAVCLFGCRLHGRLREIEARRRVRLEVDGSGVGVRKLVELPEVE